MSTATLQQLIDRDAIVDVMSRYARGIDRRDEAVYRACFTDAIDVAMGGGLQEAVDANAWVTSAFGLVGQYEATQHIISNHHVELSEDTATCGAEVQAQHWRPDGYWLIGGRYENQLVRTTDGWRIRHLELTIRWSETAGAGMAPRPPAESGDGR